jgi:glycerate kinase
VKILVAPDKFKGTMTAQQVCDAVKAGIFAVYRNATVECIPLADGGEGTCELLTSISGGKKIEITVHDPLLRKISAEFGISPDGRTAFIEMAKASGLQLLEPAKRNPMLTTTYGTGELIAAALDRGVEEIILGVGGSATNDGGVGMASALGFSFLSVSGDRIEPTGQELIHIKNVKESNLHPRLRQVKFTLICDVNNALIGSNGAANIFARQKGASEKEVLELDAGLVHLRNIIQQQFGVAIDFPGAGAGGGLGGGARFFLQPVYSQGIDFILDYTRLADRIAKADLIITGEGKIDSQTLLGKTVFGVASKCKKWGRKCVAVCGKNELSKESARGIGLDVVADLETFSKSETEAIANADQLLRAMTAERISGWLGLIN